MIAIRRHLRIAVVLVLLLTVSSGGFSKYLQFILLPASGPIAWLWLSHSKKVLIHFDQLLTYRHHDVSIAWLLAAHAGYGYGMVIGRLQRALKPLHRLHLHDFRHWLELVVLHAVVIRVKKPTVRLAFFVRTHDSRATSLIKLILYRRVQEWRVSIVFAFAVISLW